MRQLRCNAPAIVKFDILLGAKTMATQKQNQQPQNHAEQVVSYHCDQCGHEIQVDVPRAGSHAPVCCGEEMRIVRHETHQRHDCQSTLQPSAPQRSGSTSDQSHMPYGKSQQAGKFSPGVRDRD
jgi:hypothetical protein